MSGKAPDTKPQETGEKLPFVSIIVPVHNEEHRIRKCVESLLSQSYPSHRSEILIVDNGSTDKTRETVRSCEQKGVRLLEEREMRSSYAARNKGIREARGSILAFTDADAEADQDWIIRSVEAMDEEKAWYAGTRVDLYPSNDPPTAADYVEMAFSFQVGSDMQRNRYAPTVAMIAREKLFQKTGLFKADLFSGGDAELGTRVYTRRLKQIYIDDAVVRHPTRGSVKALARKNLRYGYGQAKLMLMCPRRFHRASYVYFLFRHFLPPRPDYVWGKLRRAGLASLPFGTKLRVYLIFYMEQVIRSYANFAGLFDRRKSSAFRSEKDRRRQFTG